MATILSSLAPLAYLACPVGMGLMMWVMARGSKGAKPSKQEPQTQYSPQTGRLDLLREEHLRLSAAIDELEHGSTPASSSHTGAENHPH